MVTFLKNIHDFFVVDNSKMKIGLSQFKETSVEKKSEPSIKSKNVKLSDLMRRVG